MIKLQKTESWYRPYKVTASNTDYFLDNIIFYNVNGPVVTTNGGWAQDSNGTDIPCIELPVGKIVRRNQVKFDGAVFGIVKHSSYDREKRLTLYIPMEMLHIEYVEKRKMYGNQVYKIYKGDFDILCKQYVESLDVNLSKIREQYEELLKDVSGTELTYRTESVKNKLSEMMKLVEEYSAEKERVDSIVVG